MSEIGAPVMLSLALSTDLISALTEVSTAVLTEVMEGKNTPESLHAHLKRMKVLATNLARVMHGAEEHMRTCSDCGAPSEEAEGASKVTVDHTCQFVTPEDGVEA